MRAAWRAREAAIALFTIWRASVGFSSRNSESCAFTVASTKPAMCGFPSLPFVCPSNCGFWSFTEMTAASPSRTSSPSRLSSFSFSRPLSRAYLFSVRVRAERKPCMCVPPSIVLMLLAKEKIES